MKENEIIESNVLISKFMGAIDGDDDWGWMIPYGEMNFSFDLFDRKMFENDGGSGWKKVDLKYHKDWNWLMTVVEKIESLGYSSEIYCIGGFEHRTQFFSCGVCPFKSKNYNTKIESVFNGVIKFIEWYNENK